MAVVNALLVSWPGGMLWVENAGSIGSLGRYEGFLQVGSAGSEAEATRVAQAVLAVRSVPGVAFSGEIEPQGGDEPYTDYQVADWITIPNEALTPTSAEVRAVTVTTDEDGAPIFVAEFDTIHDIEEQRLQRWLNRMAHGSLSGTTEAAGPLPLPSPPPSPGRAQTLLPFHWPGAPAAPLVSGAQKPLLGRAVRIIGYEVVITGTTTSHVSGSLLITPGSGSGAFNTMFFDYPAGSPGGSFLADPAVTHLVDGAVGDVVQFQLDTTGGASSVVYVPIVG